MKMLAKSILTVLVLTLFVGYGYSEEDFKMEVSGNETFSFEINLYEYQGHAWIGWNSPQSFIPNGTYVVLHKGPLPEFIDPVQFKNFVWFYPHDPIGLYGFGGGNRNHPDKGIDTGMDWGSGWSAAMVCYDRPARKYVYLAKTPVTSRRRR